MIPSPTLEAIEGTGGNEAVMTYAQNLTLMVSTFIYIYIYL
jgi:hypothetical protein